MSEVLNGRHGWTRHDVTRSGASRPRQGTLTGSSPREDPDYRRIEQLFQEAVARVAADRRAFLAAACAGEDALRSRVEALLAAHDVLATGADGPDFLEAIEPAHAAALVASTKPGVGPGVDPAAELPAQIGRYEVMRCLGRGGMGVVYLARDPVLDRAVALKLLPPELGADRGAARRLVREARSASALDHPNIGTVHEVGEMAGRQPFIAMAYYGGGTLRERLSAGPMPVAEAVDIAAQVAEGLAAAHAAGIVHRDIKPENLLLTPLGLVKIVDFGVARAAAAEATQTGRTPGTAAYMSPEQTVGHGVDERTDLWSLGVVLFEMLAGTRPFGGGGSAAVIHGIRHDVPPSLATLRPELPATVVAVVERCLEKDPARRFESGHALADALRAAVAGPVAGSGRSPWQLAATYTILAVATWLAAGSVTRVAGLPAVVPAIALVLLLAGLPIVMTTALVQRGAGHALARVLTWRRAVAGGVLAFALLAVGAGGYSAMRTFGIGPPATLAARGLLTERDPIVLADFATDTADAHIGRVVTEALRIDLLQSPSLRLAEPADVAGALRRMGLDPADGVSEAAARELAQREGLKAVIAGEVRALGGQYLLAARIISAVDGTTHAAMRETARDSSDLINAIDRLSKRVRERAGESLRALHAAEPLPRVATASLPALRRYADAMQLHHAGTDEARATALLEDAVALDSTFAMAHRGLAVLYWNRRADRARTAAAMRRAWELRDRLPERERLLIEATYAFHFLGDPRRAEDAYRRALAHAPDDPGAINNLGLMLMFQGRAVEAEAVLRQGLRPGSPALIRMNVADALVFQGRTDAALAVLDSGTVAYGENPLWEVARIRILGGARRYGEAERAAQAAVAREDGAVQLRIAAVRSLWHLALKQGRLREAERHYASLVPLLEQAGGLETLARAMVQRAEAWRTLLGDSARARAEIAALIDHPTIDPLTVGASLAPHAAAVLAASGDTTAATRLLARWEAIPTELRTDARRISPELARARIELAAGRPAAAADRLRRTVAAERNEAMEYLHDLGIAWQLAGQPDSAIASLARLRDIRHVRRMHRLPAHFGPALLRLGDLYEQTGRPDSARAAYAELIDLWRDADPELHPHVEHARRRLAAIDGDRNAR